jgi:dTDP-4-dehydrorhamnose reductase/dTDP-4-dehydrorhamnose 3,5-epimerase
MTVTPTAIPDVKLCTPQVFGDARGWFYEAYSAEALREAGIDCVFVQDNRSFSAAKGTLRGLHCQKAPFAQSKLICCTRGKILDVAVDLREGSPTYLKHVAVTLSAENKQMLFIPKGFLHGFVTLTDNVEVFYKVDAYYNKDADRSVRYNDPVFAIDWGVETPVLSQKDQNAPLLSASDVRFTDGGVL